MTPPDLSRRQVLAGAAGVAGALALGTQGHASAATRLPTPAASGIDHIVVLMMENRSFDHYLGWLPGADGRQAGLSYVDRDGVTRSTHRLTDYQGCAHPDPDHSFEGGRVQYNGGRCDGWLRSGENDEFAIGYYDQEDLGFYGHAAPYWTTFDRYFSATLAETYPNRFYQHSAQTDRIHNSTDVATMPTIWDRLADQGVPHAYYYVDVPFLALYGTKYLDIARSWAQFKLDAAAGTLPAVSFLDPKFLDEGTGSSADDHPHADIRAGQSFLNDVYEAVTGGPGWARTALVVNYDEWGGFFDHVPPTTAPGRDPGGRHRDARLPHPGADGVAAGAARARRARRLRPHLGAQDDRVALGAGAADPARRRGPQHRRGAGLRLGPGPVRAAVGRAAGGQRAVRSGRHRRLHRLAGPEGAGRDPRLAGRRSRVTPRDTE